MLVIRLSRTGRKKRPMYRIVLQERSWSPKSKAIEILGNVNPHTDPATINLKEDRIRHWISEGAQPSNTVHNMLVTKGIIEGKKKRSVTGKKKGGEEEESADAGGEKPAEEKKEEAPAEEKKEEPAEEKKEEPAKEAKKPAEDKE